MASASAHFNRAVALHREAAAHVEAARAELARQQATPALSAGQLAAYQRMAQVLDAAATKITPGWLGCALDGRARARKLGVDARLGEAMHVLAGTGLLGQPGEAVQPAPHPPAGAAGTGCEFAVAVPFLGVGHLAVDRDARDPRVAGLAARAAAAGGGRTAGRGAAGAAGRRWHARVRCSPRSGAGRRAGVAPRRRPTSTGYVAVLDEAEDADRRRPGRRPGTTCRTC